tara:strand:- start:173 stop:748 length:576 start_codon:yes stop_codon:yes gene_type:complete
MSEDKEITPEEEELVKKAYDKSITSKEKVENSKNDVDTSELKKIKILENENSELKDKILRLQADNQNLLKQKEKQMTNEIKKNKYDLLLEFITIYEDLIRAEGSLSKNNVDTSGLDGIKKNMEKILSENYITPIDAIGKPFDPQIHEAVSVAEDDSVDDGTIIQEVAKGYYAEKRILKPSKVIVSKKKSEK